jgi:23S rRNA-/tRNA-specific pseudouridylate synthase
VTGVRILSQGPHHAVLYKPAGMVVVAGRGVPRPTLLDVAIELFGGGVRPVHRIDRVTTGLCLVAKTLFGQQALSDAFRRHLVDKRYLCVVQGIPKWQKLDVDARLARIDDPDGQQAKAAGKKGSGKKGPLAWQTIDDQGVRALTRLRVLATGNDCALLEARPETGRMHQIRIHCAHVGHPLIGDTLYGGTATYPDAAGIALVAYAISFPVPHSKRAFVVGELPSAFSALLKERALDTEPMATLKKQFEAQASKQDAGTTRPTTQPPPGRRGPGAAHPRRSPSAAGSPRSGTPHRGGRRSR